MGSERYSPKELCTPQLFQLTHIKVLLMRRFSMLFMAAMFAALMSTAFAQDLAGSKPNIVFVITDDQGYGDVSGNGNPVLKTPNMDRLRSEGVRFEDFMVSPTCSPTRSAVMTGRHEFRNGITHTILERERLTLDATTLPQVLKTAGYTTGIFGKWHLGDEPEYWPSSRGFDEMFIHGCGGIGQTYAGSCGDAPGNKYFNPMILHNGKFEKTDGYCTDVFFKQAQKWIGSVAKKQPFFAYIATNAPHAPLNCPQEYEDKFAGRPKNEAAFFGMIANIDDNLGRLLADLKTLGIENDTLVIFMNDNGGTVGTKVFNAGMRGQKVQPYIGGTRASQFWRWPGTLKPQAVMKLTAHIDILPTLADIAGAKLDDKTKKQVEGRSFVSLLKDPEANWADRYLVTHTGRWPKGEDPNKSKYASCAIRNSRFAMVSAGQKAKWELFDLKDDYGQKNDIAAEQPEVVKQMKAAYDKWWDDTLPLLVNENAEQPKENPYKTLFRQQFGKETQ